MAAIAYRSVLHAQTKPEHYYVSGPHYRDYYLLLDEQGGRIFDMHLAEHIREAHRVCDEHGDRAAATLLEMWIDDTERHVCYVFGRARR